MEEREWRILLEEKRKFEKIKQASRRLQRLSSKPKLDLDENPFCASKQLNDWKELHRSPLLAQELQKKKFMKQGSGNNLQDILKDTLTQIESGKPFEPGARRRRRPASPVTSPSSPHHHFDVLSLMKDAEILQDTKMAAKGATLPASGLLSVDDLLQLMQGPEQGKQHNRKVRKNKKEVQNTESDERPRWNDRVFDPITEREQNRGRERKFEQQVSALSRSTSRHAFDSYHDYSHTKNRASCGLRDEPFCLDRQREDEKERAYLNFHATFPDLNADKL